MSEGREMTNDEWHDDDDGEHYDDAEEEYDDGPSAWVCVFLSETVGGGNSLRPGFVEA